MTRPCKVYEALFPSSLLALLAFDSSWAWLVQPAATPHTRPATTPHTSTAAWRILEALEPGGCRPCSVHPAQPTPGWNSPPFEPSDSCQRAEKKKPRLHLATTTRLASGAKLHSKSPLTFAPCSRDGLPSQAHSTGRLLSSNADRIQCQRIETQMLAVLASSQY